MPTPFAKVPLACPLDRLELRETDAGLTCGNNHTFDVAKFGYANLLPVQFKSSKDPGDSKAMVVARRALMNTGFFAKLSAQLGGIVAKEIQATTADSALIVDAGCGEGYFTHAILEAVQSATTQSVDALGIDISKWAVQSAARRYDKIAWAVANNKRLPVAPGRADIILSIFGFETWAPWAALQQPGQRVVVVDAGPAHLLELREHIYDDVLQHAPPLHQGATTSGYTQTDCANINYRSDPMQAGALNAILAMTPHGHRAKPDAIENLENAAPLALTIDVVVRVFTR